jgi:hypothetical protein
VKRKKSFERERRKERKDGEGRGGRVIVSKSRHFSLVP